MNTARTVAAIDLGAESGRVMLARFDGRHLRLDEVRRFLNRPVTLDGHRLWNMLGLWQETLDGLRKARQMAGRLDSVGVDTWGVDYGLINAEGLLCAPTYHYRDHRTDDVMDAVFARISRETIYRRTGIQFMPINTLFQLYAHQRQYPQELTSAHRLLMIPDLLHTWLSGTQVSERTNATTTQCWDPVAADWARDLLDELGIPTTLLPPVVEAGTLLGQARPEWRADLGAAKIIAPATHDTGSAIAAVPVATGTSWAYISSGTWSLVGAELPHPVVTAEALAANWTNEGGVFGATRFLKNVTGLWLLQECQRAWTQDQWAQDYDALLVTLDSVPPFAALIDPDHPSFLAPAHMPDAINAYLRTHGQQPLSSPAAFARCILESLALRYCEVLRQLELLAQRRFEVIHVVGGGSRNVKLNQWLANAFGAPVIAGPTEATALGNALLQLVGLGELHTLSEIREVSQQTPTQVYLPSAGDRVPWEEMAERFAQLSTVDHR